MQRMADEMENYVGLDRIKLIHLNDSKGAVGFAHRPTRAYRFRQDRDKGSAAVSSISGPFSDVPLILETPKKRSPMTPRIWQK